VYADNRGTVEDGGDESGDACRLTGFDGRLLARVERGQCVTEE
jgi:hypothetical protein